MRISIEDQKVNGVKKKLNKIKKTFPRFIYRKCDKCKELVKKEWVWYKWFFCGIMPIGDEYYKSYLCKKCAPTKIEAYNYYRQYDIDNMMNKE